MSDFFKDEFVHALDAAQRDLSHAQTVTQTRLYNFLFASSILILAWVTVYASSNVHVHSQFVVLMILSVLNFALAVAYDALGSRGNKFIQLHSDIVLQLESHVSEPLRTMEHLMTLQRGDAYTCQSTFLPGKPIKLNWLEKSPICRNHLLALVPRGFAVASVLLFVLSFSYASR